MRKKPAKDIREKENKGEDVVALRDLMPKRAVTGGDGKVLFGERLQESDEKRSSDARPPRRR